MAYIESPDIGVHSPLHQITHGGGSWYFKNREDLPGQSSYLLVPSSFSIEYEDVSASDAGRTEDGTMWKLKIGVVRKLEMEWQNIKGSEMVQRLMNAFDSEYMEVKFYDLKAGGYVTSTFYCGNRSTPLYNGVLGIWSSFKVNLIERRVYNG